MILTNFKHSKIIFNQYIILMKTISMFILLIYWSIMIFAPVMSKDIKLTRAKISHTKQVEQNHYVICDGGIAQNFLLAKTENTLRKLNTPTIWQSPENAEKAPIKAACQFVGSSCSKDDVIGKQSDENILPQPGDIAIFDNCGAYNASYTVAPFLQLPAASSYIIE